MLLLLLAAESLAAGNARQVLSDKGLGRLGNSSVWISREEADVIRRLADLPKLAEDVVGAEKRIAQHIDQNRELWGLRVKSEQRLTKLKRVAGADDAARQELEKLVISLREQTVDPARLATHAAARRLVIHWSRLRDELMLSVFRIRDVVPVLADQYDALRTDPAVQAALEQLRAPHRLGPVKDYAGELPRVAQWERLVQSPYIPLYGDNGRWRVSGIINESLPVTFTWHEGSDPTWVTHNMATAAGLQISSDAARQQITVAPGRQLKAVRVRIGYLRFGGSLLRDVDAYVLPPEGEDVGAHFRATDLAGFVATMRPDQLRIDFRPVR